MHMGRSQIWDGVKAGHSGLDWTLGWSGISGPNSGLKFEITIIS